jgi:hypothetical protein
MGSYWLTLMEFISTFSHGQFFEINLKFRHYQRCDIFAGQVQENFVSPQTGYKYLFTEFRASHLTK